MNLPIGGVGAARVKRWRYYVTELGRPIVREEMAEFGQFAEAAILDALRRAKRGELMPYEHEHIEGDLRAIRVFLDGDTYRVLYAEEGMHDQVLLALHAHMKKDRKLSVRTKQLAARRLRDWRMRGG